MEGKESRVGGEREVWISVVVAFWFLQNCSIGIKRCLNEGLGMSKFAMSITV